MLIICAFDVAAGQIATCGNLHLENQLCIHYTSTHVTIQPPSLHPPFLTNYLEASVFVKLSDVSCAEPPLAVFVYKEIFLVFRLVLVVPHGYVGSADQNLSSRMRLVSATVTT